MPSFVHLTTEAKCCTSSGRGLPPQNVNLAIDHDEIGIVGIVRAHTAAASHIDTSNATMISQIRVTVGTVLRTANGTCRY